MKRFYQIWLIALVIKTVLAIWLPFSNDEAYYWVWGHHPQLSYFDHPPMVGWLFSLGSVFESIGNGARLPGVWLGHFTLLIWTKILEPYLSEKRKSAWLVFILLSPFFGAGSLVITPDVPLLFFWSLSMYVFLRLIREPTPALYLALGAALGLSFCSKYMTVLFVPVAFAWLAYSGDWRRVKWHYIPLTIIAGLAFCSPVLYWNATHDWASFKFQLDHGLTSTKWSELWPGEYLGGQILLLFPTVAWLATRRREPKEARFLHFFGWLPLAFFLYTSFKAHVEANWPIMAHPSILALAFLNAPESKAIRSTIVIWIVAHVIVISEAVHHWIPVDPRQLKTSEFTRYDALVPLTKSSALPVYFGSYQIAAAISYKTRTQYYKLNGMNRRDFYDFIPQSTPKKSPVLLVAEISAQEELAMPYILAKRGYHHGAIKQLTPDFRTFEIYAQDTNR